MLIHRNLCSDGFPIWALHAEEPEFTEKFVNVVPGKTTKQQQNNNKTTTKQQQNNNKTTTKQQQNNNKKTTKKQQKNNKN